MIKVIKDCSYWVAAFRHDVYSVSKVKIELEVRKSRIRDAWTDKFMQVEVGDLSELCLALSKYPQMVRMHSVVALYYT